jgi:integrase
LLSVSAMCSMSNIKSGTASGAGDMRKRYKLNTLQVAKLSKPGKYSDGGGLYLAIGTEGRRRWVWYFAWQGRRREMGLGSVAYVTLAKAREKAEAARAVLEAGGDPLAVATARVPTFGDAADLLIADLRPGWKNTKHADQWAMTLQVYCAELRDRPVDQIATEDVLRVLRPIWQTKPETAARVRGRIERVLNAAKARKFRSGENPAAWRGHLQLMLPAPIKLSRGHHTAMALDDVPAFVDRLRDAGSVSALALEFIILTGARSGEVMRSKRHGVIDGARWSEIDRDRALWTVPVSRMKAGREHQVPLSRRALDVLSLMDTPARRTFVFPATKGDVPLSEGSAEMLLRRMGAKPATVHGFRSCFRDWAGDRTVFPRELIEHALAHVLGDKAEQAYRRGTAVEKRRAVMEAWAGFCSGSVADNVVAIGKRV